MATYHTIVLVVLILGVAIAAPGKGGYGGGSKSQSAKPKAKEAANPKAKSGGGGKMRPDMTACTASSECSKGEDCMSLPFSVYMGDSWNMLSVCAYTPNPNARHTFQFDNMTMDAGNANYTMQSIVRNLNPIIQRLQKIEAMMSRYNATMEMDTSRQEKMQDMKEKKSKLKDKIEELELTPEETVDLLNSMAEEAQSSTEDQE